MFNSEQMNQLNNFMNNITANNEFQNQIINKYNNDPMQLSIVEIYAIEKIMRLGQKGIFDKVSKMADNDSKAVAQFSQFSELFNTDQNFQAYKSDQFKNNPETLSELELFALSMMIKKEEETTNENNYSYSDEEDNIYTDFNPILYSNEYEIRETLTNLFFGEFIFQLLEKPECADIKRNQYKPGMIANKDKQFIINSIRRTPKDIIERIANVIDNRYISVFLQLKLGEEEHAFDEWTKYNTNILAKQIFPEQYEQQRKKR